MYVNVKYNSWNEKCQQRKEIARKKKAFRDEQQRKEEKGCDFRVATS